MKHVILSLTSKFNNGTELTRTSFGRAISNRSRRCSFHLVITLVSLSRSSSMDRGGLVECFCAIGAFSVDLSARLTIQSVAPLFSLHYCINPPTVNHSGWWSRQASTLYLPSASL